MAENLRRSFLMADLRQGNTCYTKRADLAHHGRLNEDAQGYIDGKVSQALVRTLASKTQAVRPEQTHKLVNNAAGRRPYAAVGLASLPSILRRSSKRAALRSLAALFLIRRASNCSSRDLVRAFSALALWMLSMRTRRFLKTLPLQRR